MRLVCAGLTHPCAVLTNAAHPGGRQAAAGELGETRSPRTPVLGETPKPTRCGAVVLVPWSERAAAAVSLSVGDFCPSVCFLAH